MLGDIAAGPAYRFTQWLDLVRKRSATYGSSGFPHRLHRIDDMVTRLRLYLNSALYVEIYCHHIDKFCYGLGFYEY